MFLILQSKTVEHRHAVLEWNTKQVAFAVRDLDSMNGVSISIFILTHMF